MNFTDPARVRLNEDKHKLLQKLAPGVFLASAAYSDQKAFITQYFPVLYEDTLLSIRTPDTFNDTQVHVALAEEWDPKFRPLNSTAPAINVVFSFRGTEPWRACDWLQDLNYTKREITWWHPISSNPEAHDGFLFSLESCTEYKEIAANGQRIPYDRNNVNDVKGRTLDWAIKDVISKYNGNAVPHQLTLSSLTRIVVVGHSLGGAIATVASVWARVRLPQYLPGLKGKHVTCITTGCPRVGNDDFAHAYFDMMNKGQNFESYRIVNNRDVVPGVPLESWGFRHVGTPIWLFRKRNNWAYLQFTMVDRLHVNGNDEVTVRPYGLALSGPDHFQWHYNAAFAQAVATTIVPTRAEFEKMESTFMRVVARSVEKPFALLLSFIFNILGVFVVTLGRSFLVDAARHRTRIPAPLYRFLVNMMFIFFTAPLWVFTHVVYWLES